MYIRVRPPDSYHNYDNSSTTANCLEVTTPTTVIVHSKPESKVFTFDNVAGPETTQVWSNLCVHLYRYVSIYVTMHPLHIF